MAIVGRHYSVRNGLDAVLTSARQRVPGKQLSVRLFLVRSVAVQTFVFMHGKKAATSTSTLSARLLLPLPTSSTSFQVGRRCVLRKMA